MKEIDFHLGQPGFVDQCIDLEPLRLTKVVHLLDNRLELVHRVDAVRLPAGFAPP